MPRRGILAAGAERADELMDDLPGTQARVVGRIPVIGQFVGRSSRTLPRLDSKIPASTSPATLVFLALLRALGDAVIALVETRSARTKPAPTGCRRRSHLPVRQAPRPAFGLLE